MERRAYLMGLVLLLAVALLPAIAGSAMAASQDVTTTWNVAQDTSFSVSFPATHSGIDFDPSSGDFTNLPATDQTDAQWAYRVTNDGNVNIDIAAAFTGDFQTGITEFRTCTASSGDAPSGTCWWWTDANETNSQVIVTGLSPSLSADRWAWSTGSGVLAGIHTSTFRLTSTAS